MVDFDEGSDVFQMVKSYFSLLTLFLTWVLEPEGKKVKMNAKGSVKMIKEIIEMLKATSGK